MSGAPDHHDASNEAPEAAREPIRYPENHVLAVLDTREQTTAAMVALTSGGFLDSEIEVGTGATRADELGAATGREGLASLLIRLAERIGAADEEMETKNRYEQAMRDDRFVLSVAAPTADRKDRAARILGAHGAHTVAYFGRRTIEYLVPPDKR